MKYFFDTEFIENGSTIDLISIGIVSEDDRTLYLQNSECNFSKAGDWVWRNVFPHLIHFNMSGRRMCSEKNEGYVAGLGNRHETKCGPECFWATRKEIRDSVIKFCTVERIDTPDKPKVQDKPEFWGYFADYDWVVLCQLFGTMVELPKGFPRYCRDLKQLLDSKGNPRFQKSEDCHHALNDAEWIKEVFTEVSKMA